MTAIKYPKVIIIGGGLGGLTFAQCLRKHGIPFEVYERDDGPEARAQGFSLQLHWILEELLCSIPADMPPLKNTSATATLDLPACGIIRDAVTKQERNRLGNGDNPRECIRSNRAALREWLCTGIDVHWGKKFTRYEESPDGVTAYFEDGSCATGEILVGADSVQSQVREQILGPVAGKAKILPLGNLCGEVDLTREEYLQNMELGRSYWMAAGPDNRLFVGPIYISADKQSARYYWLFGWIDEAATAPGYWAYSATPEERLQYVKDRTAYMAPEFQQILNHQTPELVGDAFATRTLKPSALPVGRVTLLGDAAHPMTPYRAEGAAHAMKDAVNLASLLNLEIKMSTMMETDQLPDLPTVLKKYEAEMIKRGAKAVELSELAAKTMGKGPFPGPPTDD